MLPFRIDIRPGLSLHKQVLFAIKKAIVSGRLQAGDRFPSVRQLSKELGINPNTAHKVVASLVAEELLEVRPGIGTVIAASPPASPRARGALLGHELERLVVEAKQLSLDLTEVVAALGEHWQALSRPPGSTLGESGGDDTKGG